MIDPTSNIKQYKISIECEIKYSFYSSIYDDKISVLNDYLKDGYLPGGVTLPKPISLADPAFDVVDSDNYIYHIQLWKVTEYSCDEYEYTKVEPHTIQEAVANW